MEIATKRSRKNKKAKSLSIFLQRQLVNINSENVEISGGFKGEEGIKQNKSRLLNSGFFTS